MLGPDLHCESTPGCASRGGVQSAGMSHWKFLETKFSLYDI